MTKKIQIYFFVLLIFCLLSCSVDQAKTEEPKPSQKVLYKNPKTGVESIIQKVALDAFQENYSGANFHKAFVQSLSGSWAWIGDATSKELAIKSALASCHTFNQDYEELYPCEVINVDDEWIEN